MSNDAAELTGPDFIAGIAESDLAEGAMLAGHAEGEPVLIARQGGQVYAIGATCTHYGGPLAEGLLGDGMVHCPWHHACFDLATGRAVGAPALNPVSCWQVEERDRRIRITGRRDAPAPPREPAGAPESIVIVGAGAAGNAAAEELRAQGYEGSITMIGMEDDVPYDR
ncbi:MAG TPA: Rieske 2Fe-2S domain-containing protein, partial [Gemmatimonadales bacterium]|nr:Rieske 2Fe-2S domain-containing protein [Gemmatimonadales bacterium]